MSGYEQRSGPYEAVARRRMPVGNDPTKPFDDLRRGSQRHDRQVLTSREVADVQVEPHARPAAHLGVRGSTRRISWPPRPGLESWLHAGWREGTIDLVGRRRIQSVVGSPFVVPDREERKLGPKRSTQERDEHTPSALLLHRPDESLDHSNAAVAANRAEALSDPTAPAPAAERLIGELPALVGDEMARRRSDIAHDSAEEGPDGYGHRLLSKDGKAAKPMMRREQWSTTTATHQQKGQHCGSAKGNQEVQRPSEVGTVVRSVNHT